MAIPSTAKKFDVMMDPAELLEYQTDLAGNLLEVGETIASYTLTMGAEGTALGASIRNDGDYVPQTPGSTSIKFWLEVSPAFRENSAFDAGVDVPIVATVTTSNVPPRRRQRTVVVRVQQQ